MKKHLLQHFRVLCTIISSFLDCLKKWDPYFREQTPKQMSSKHKIVLELKVDKVANLVAKGTRIWALLGVPKMVEFWCDPPFVGSIFKFKPEPQLIATIRLGKTRQSWIWESIQELETQLWAPSLAHVRCSNEKSFTLAHRICKLKLKFMCACGNPNTTRV